MKPFRLSLLLGLVWMSGCHEDVPGSENNSLRPSSNQHLQIPVQGAYTGAFIDFGDTEDQVSLEAMQNFETLVGKPQAIIASSSYWGENSFPRRNLDLISNYGAIPLIYWSPWDKPYQEDKPPTKFDLRKILAGDSDAYIDHWADEAKIYGHPMMVSWGLEMNGNWFPWSGCFYQSQGQIGPEIYKRCYRYVVDRVRARGATNILWVFHVNNYSSPKDLWNQMNRYYPGRHYVDWLGMSVYGKQFSNGSWFSFSDAMDYAYLDICQLDPTLPVMLAEWGIGEFPEAGSKEAWIQDAFGLMSTKYPRLKAAIFWDERWQNPDDTYSNLRVNSSPGALKAYREGVASDFWLGRPIWK